MRKEYLLVKKRRKKEGKSMTIYDVLFFAKVAMARGNEL